MQVKFSSYLDNYPHFNSQPFPMGSLNTMICYVWAELIKISKLRDLLVMKMLHYTKGSYINRYDHWAIISIVDWAK